VSERDPKTRPSEPGSLGTRASSPRIRASSPVIEHLDGAVGETERSLQARARTSGKFERPPTPKPVAPAWHRPVRIAIWIALALPALYQLGLLITAIGGRFAYPYDLEWMEGGMLHHAQRIRDGAGIYVAPSVEFIPYLYTPLYPSVLALLGGAFGVTYSVGRAISILSLLGIATTAALQIPSSRHDHARRGPPWTGVALGLGLFAAAYPISEGWYDLVRADTLFLMLVTVGIGALPRWCKTGTGIGGHAQVAASATILTLAFFCKQTGFVYVAFGGLMVLVLAWRRVGGYILISGLLGLGGTWVMQSSTDGWFWTYISEIHRAHDFNMERFWKSFWFILWKTDGHPLLGAPITLVVVSALSFVAVTRWKKGVFVTQARPLLIWSSVFVVSVVVGAIGWGTEFAHFNAYIPAQLHGALAAGAAVPAVYACAKLWWGDRPNGDWIATGVAAAIALPLAITCLTARWSPSKFIPTARDLAAGDKLIERLSKIEGEVWMPSHPWYLYMAGKTPRVHRMGIKDVTARQARTVAGLDDALSKKGFSAIVLDNVDLHNRESLPALHRNYRAATRLAETERPRVFTGARVVPDEIWLPITSPKAPAGAKVVFDFEHAVWAGWQRSGVAWGNGPVETSPSGQGIVDGVSGRRFATSMHDGDKSTGRVTSPAILLDAAKLTLRAGGGTDSSKLRIELYIEDARAPSHVVSVPEPGGDKLEMLTIPIPADKRGKTGKLVFIDDSPTSHLVVDDVWAWQD
jgi:hypothetical protein